MSPSLMPYPVTEHFTKATATPASISLVALKPAR